LNRRIVIACALAALILAVPLAHAADVPSASPQPSTSNAVDKGDTAWMLVSTGLVLLMVPGLALFYGGMVRRKNVLGTMMHSMVALALIGVQWVLFGYSLAFGATHGGFIGWDANYLGLHGVSPDVCFPGTNIPIFVHCMYQGMFAIITPALISGALAERVRFGPYCLFILLWAVLVYDPLAHWIWAVAPRLATAANPATSEPVGWLGSMGALDFAGGTVVHVSAGFAGLAAILVLRKRRGYPGHVVQPNSMVLTLIGAGLLWFGWFGFNGGSALGSGPLAGVALAASQVGAAAAALSWLAAEWLHRGKPTALGLASGLVAGLVAVTPAAGFVSPLGALCIGLIAGVVCYGAVCLKPFLKYDDSLDAFGVHGVGGFLGALLTGVFVSAWIFNRGNGFPDGTPLGLLASGRGAQIGVQALAALCAAGYSFLVTLVLVKAIDMLWGFTLSAKAENEGLDQSQHGEAGFDLGPAVDLVPETGAHHEPRPAAHPPNGQQRFTVAVESPSPDKMMQAWSEMCQAGSKPPPEFRAVYPFVTTIRDGRFRFRGGDPTAMRENLERLFRNRLGGADVRAVIEK
jgi:ammonium transporter, Amt family